MNKGFEKVKGVFGKKNSYSDKERHAMVVFRVMQAVGGYTEFMDMPLSAYRPLAKAAINFEKMKMDMMKKMMGGK